MSAVHIQSSSDALIVISANIEGLTANKASILSELCKDKHCHCLCLQETHRAKDRARLIIPGMPLAAGRPHNKHGSSVFVRDGLKEDNVEVITVELPGVVVHYVYKPPTEQFLLHPLGRRSMLHIVNGDFNIHKTLWGYTSTDNDGEAVDLWAESNNISLIHNSTVLYGRKGTTLNPYLYRQTFQIYVRSLLSIQSPHTTPPNMCQYKPSNCCTTYHIQKTLQHE